MRGMWRLAKLVRALALRLQPAGDLVCSACEGKLAKWRGKLVCRACETGYPVLQGVPLLLPGAGLARGPAPDEGFVEDLARIAAPSAPDAARGPLRELFSHAITFPDRHLGVEGHRFLHRLRSSGHPVRNPDGSAPERPDAGSNGGDGPAVQSPDTEPELATLTAPPAVRAESGFAVQVRVLNRGPGVLTSTGDTPFYLSYWAKPPGAADAEEGRRTALLIDLPPGGVVTQPVFIAPPRHAGTWSYEITPLIEHVRWQPGAAVRLEVPVVPASAPDPLATGWPQSDTVRDYGEDHVHAVALMGEWLRSRLAGRRLKPRVLELGGNAAPMLAAGRLGLPGARLYNLDIDPYGLAFGTIQRRIGGGRAVRDVFGDGMRLPFADASLDAVVMFATLHHFPDPVGLLRHLRTKLAPGGLICVMCEPVSAVSREYLPDDYREELLDGICEQAFQPWEYRQFFEAAGLRVVRAMLDVGSLKVALEAGPAVAPSVAVSRPVGAELGRVAA